MMIDVRSAQDLPRKRLQQIILFVRRVIGADHGELAIPAQLGKLFGNGSKCDGPGDRLQLAAAPHQRRRQALGMLIEVEAVAPFDAEELAIEAGVVAVVGANDLAVSHAERCLAAVRAMRANSADVLHLPGPRLIAVRSAGERADRADIDAGAALVALEMIAAIRNNFCGGAAIPDSQGAHAP